MVLCITVVKLAKHECSFPCNTHQWNGFVSDASALQTEDVYEGISSPQCICFASSGLLKPQEFISVATVTGMINWWIGLTFSRYCVLYSLYARFYQH